MKFVIVGIMGWLAFTGMASAHEACTRNHSVSFCHVKADRHAIRVLRHQIHMQAARTGIRLEKLKPVGKLSWNVRRIHKANRWHRHVLKVLRAAPSRVRIHMLGAWLCIHHYEGGWTDATGNGYYGGLQMDTTFMYTYGSDMIREHHGGYANTWTPLEQMIVAERAYYSGRGFYPWPNTARFCGLI